MDKQDEGIAVGTHRVDFFVEDKILVEIKALIELENVHLAQAINYLEAFDLEVGLLLNFGAMSLQVQKAPEQEEARRQIV